MKIREILESHFRGWLPKTPDIVNATIINLCNPRLRQISKLFSVIGAVLIAFFCYNTLLVVYNVNLSLSILWLFLITYIVGIELAIVGFTLRARFNSPNQISAENPLFLSGLAFLTMGILGFIFDEFFGAFNLTYPFSVNSLFLRFFIYWKAGWVSQAFLVVSVLGAILILSGNACSRAFKPENGKTRSSKTYYLLFAGVMILIAGLLLQVLSLISTSVFFLIQPSFWAFFAYINPLGVLCVSLAWIMTVTSLLKRKPVLLPTLYIVFVAVLVLLFLIPIK
ncbi:MAG: hypothetical protein ABSE15_00120 [Candidatus Bathyarchaeia archaeon]|jgi:hypothetical protein